MSTHEQFEEMCALAAAGQLGRDDLLVLEAHLDECYACRALVSDLSLVHVHLLPEAAESIVAPEDAADAGLRRQILSAAVRAGARFSSNAFQSVPASRPFFAGWKGSGAWVPVALVATAVASLAAGASLQKYLSPLERPAPIFVRVSPPTQVPNPTKSMDAGFAAQQQKELELERSLASLRQEQNELKTRLAEVQQRAASLGSANSEAAARIAELQGQLERARNEQAKAEADLADLKANHMTDEAIMIAQTHEIEQLNQKLTDQASALDRDRQMFASGREIRDLIAARNLHIIDVYDTDSSGKTSSAFGRVFYTEGKSLVFYAYDLGDHRAEKGDLAFYVWGKRDGAPHDIKKLGALMKDDRAQRRWIFTLTDPKVLAQIDSVFITLEPNKQEKRPRGKRLLAAFLGSPPNHP